MLELKCDIIELLTVRWVYFFGRSVFFSRYKYPSVGIQLCRNKAREAFLQSAVLAEAALFYRRINDTTPAERRIDMKTFITKLLSVALVFALMFTALFGTACQKNKDDSGDSTVDSVEDSSQGTTSDQSQGTTSDQSQGTTSDQSSGGADDKTSGEYTAAQIESILKAVDAQTANTITLVADRKEENTRSETDLSTNETTTEKEEMVGTTEIVYDVANAEFDMVIKNVYPSEGFEDIAYVFGRSEHIFIHNENDLDAISNIDWSDVVFDYHMTGTYEDEIYDVIGEPFKYILQNLDDAMNRVNHAILALGYYSSALTHEGAIATLDVNLLAYNLLNSLSSVVDSADENSTVGDILNNSVVRTYLEGVVGAFTPAELKEILQSMMGIEVEPADGTSTYDYILKILSDESVAQALFGSEIEGSLAEMTVGELIAIITHEEVDASEFLPQLKEQIGELKKTTTKSEIDLGGVIISDAKIEFTLSNDGVSSQTVSFSFFTESKSGSINDEYTRTYTSDVQFEAVVTYSDSTAQLTDISDAKVLKKETIFEPGIKDVTFGLTIWNDELGTEETLKVVASYYVQDPDAEPELQSLTINGESCEYFEAYSGYSFEYKEDSFYLDKTGRGYDNVSVLIYFRIYTPNYYIMSGDEASFVLYEIKESILPITDYLN